MPRTPRLSPPARPRTGSCAASHERRKKNKGKAGRCALQCLTSDVPGCRPAAGTTAEHPPMAWIYRRSRKSVEGGVVGPAGPLAPWMAPSSPMDGFTACPAGPTTPPSHGQLLLGPLPLPLSLPWPRQVPGAARPKPSPASGTMSGPFPNYGSPDMMVLEGAPALSPFRRERLESRLQSIAPPCASAVHGTSTSCSPKAAPLPT